MRPEVAAAITAAMAEVGNPSSVHAEGRRARALVERARAQVAELVGAEPGDVVFTSGGTEANNLALSGERTVAVFASAVEHAAVLGASRNGLETFPVDRDGVADLERLDRLLAGRTGSALVALQVANNETGVVQPVIEAGHVATRHGARLHADAVQAAGRIALDVASLEVDSLALSAHKLGGPMGVGALVLAPGRDMPGHLVTGGGQENGRRGGTENVPAIVGFGLAAELAGRSVQGEAVRLRSLRDGFEARLRSLAPDAVIFGEGRPRLPNTSCFSIPGLKAETALIALDLDGVAVSSGAACSSGRVRRSHVLDAMAVEAGLADGAIRVSFGWTSTPDDVVRASGAIETLVRRLYVVRIGRAA